MHALSPKIVRGCRVVAILGMLLALVPPRALAFDHPRDDGHQRQVNPNDPPDPHKPPEKPRDPCNGTGSPCYVKGGNLYQFDADLTISTGPLLQIARSYNSSDDRTGLMGVGWFSSLELRVIHVTDGLNEGAVVRWPTGQRHYFTKQVDGSYSSPPGFHGTLTATSTGFDLVTTDGLTYRADAEGLIRQIHDRQGRSIQFLYDPVYQCIDSIQVADGWVRVSYDDARRVSRIDAPGSRSVTYSYGANGRLAQVTDGSGVIRHYAYDANGRLTGISNALNQAMLSVTYDSQGRVSRTINVDGDFTYQYGTGQTTKTLTGGGATWTYYLTDEGLVQRVVDPSGHQIQYAYDTYYNISDVIDQNGSDWSYQYDALGHLQVRRAPGGQTERWAYDDAGRVTSHTDGLGRVTTYTYDTANNLVQQVGPGGATTSMTYDARGNMTAKTDALGHSASYVYDTASHLVEEHSPGGLVSRYQYDDAGRRVSATVGGTTTTYAYDDAGRVTQIQTPGGGKTTLTYDAAGRLASSQTPDGGTTQYEYDGYDRVIRETKPSGAQVTTSYQTVASLTEPYKVLIARSDGSTTEKILDPMRRMIRQTVRGPSGDLKTESFAYDGVGHITSVTRSDGTVMGFTFDNSSELIEARQAGTLVAGYEYNATGSLVRTSLPFGRTVDIAYDPTNHVLTQADADGVYKHVTRDALGRVTERYRGSSLIATVVTDPDGRTTGITYSDASTLGVEYNANGLPTRITLPGGATYSYEWGDQRKPVRMTLPDNSAVTYSYTSAARPDVLTDAEGHATRFVYDGAGNLTQTVFADGSSKSMRYDRVTPLPTRLTDTDGATIDVAYDALDRMTSMTSSDGLTYQYEYGANGSLSAARGGVTDVVRTEDRLGRLTSEGTFGRSVSITYGDATPTATLVYPSGLTVLKTFDGRGRLLGNSIGGQMVSSVTYTPKDEVSSIQFGNGLICTPTFASDATPLEVHYAAAGGSDLAAYRVTYETSGTGLFASVRDLVRADESITARRDSRGRLVEFRQGALGADGVIGSPAHSETFTYDRVGNMLSASLDGTPETRTYDDLDQIASAGGVSYAYDGRGNLTDDGTFVYGYTTNNMLAEVHRKDTGALVARYSYDGLGRLVRKVTGSYTADYHWANGQIIEEWRDGAVYRSYVYGNRRDEAVAIVADGVISYIVRDVSGSAVALVNAAGDVIERYAYSAYGRPRILDGGGAEKQVAACPLLYRGLLYDPDLQCYYCRARWYSPRLGRFLSRDPMGVEVAGGWETLYSYAAEDPVTYQDNSGLSAFGSEAKGCSGGSLEFKIPEGFLDVLKKLPMIGRMVNVEADVSVEYKYCVKCCDDGRLIGQNEAAISIEASWAAPCVAFPPPLGTGTATNCGGLFLVPDVKVGGSLSYSENKCENHCEVAGCIDVGGGMVLGFGEMGDVGDAYVGGYVGVTGQLCPANFGCLNSISVTGQVCAEGKLFYKFTLGKLWGITIGFEGVIFEGEVCGTAGPFTIWSPSH